MSSLVSEFIINPVLRQARRFSEISRTTLTTEDHERTAPTEAEAVSVPAVAQDTVIEESETPITLGADPIMRPDTPRSRPESTSTEETRVDRITDSSLIMDEARHDRLGFPLPSKRGRGIPEDDGMHELRRRIQAVNSQSISPEEKARQMHGILLEGYRSSRLVVAHSMPTPRVDAEIAGLAWEPSSSPGPLESFKSWYSQSAAAEKYTVSASDIAPTFAPIRSRKGSDDDLQNQTASSSPAAQPPLGCQHYERNVKLQCFTCKRWYTCRFCHDAQEDHNLVRRETKNMLCMLCGTPQKASDMCINCGEISAHYYCGICKLWENRKSKPIYHCNDCGICRRGLGLGKDFFHCKSSHKCIERSTDCDCPICGEYMFTSPKPVVFMPCGHSIHKRCYDQHMRVSYKCPICNRSLANMESQFRNLDVAILSQPMPPEFRDTRATVLCNDCSGKCVVLYHWLGLKCSICQSYNTVELQIHGNGSPELQTAAERVESVVHAPTQQAIEVQRNAITSPAAANVSTSVANNWVPNRRRHSSHGVELQYRAPDRFARSLSPLETTIEDIMAHSAVDIDSDDDIFGFWRGYRSQEDDGEEEERGDDPSGEDSNEDADDDSDDDLGADDDDDEDDILLIGHR
ncbi:hypothetical protein E4U42_000482 [Claviceps africana]|uniref:Uncharacterized protein n=1 Tax=Claviceps africana TaxID=83212 RepID=A0A8K0J0N0_9HYPO|nr:hypothetical protein E4U42_000482 [Claviceps africana]